MQAWSAWSSPRLSRRCSSPRRAEITSSLHPTGPGPTARPRCLRNLEGPGRARGVGHRRPTWRARPARRHQPGRGHRAPPVRRSGNFGLGDPADHGRRAADGPRPRLPWVHVRDVADAHIEAMTSEAAGANRTIVATDPLSLIDVAAVLRERLPEASGKIPRRAMTTWLTWVASVFEPQLRDIRWLIGSAQRFDHDPDEVLLGHFLRSPTRSRR